MKTPEEITRWCDMMLKRHPNVEDTNFFNSIKDYMKEQRPQGEWGPCYENYKNGMFYRDCSICGKATITGDWKFCPYCGAEMKGGAE